MNWYNEPPSWHVEGDTIRVRTGQGTDFWRVTYYDFIHDNGHFYYQTVEGDFTAEVRVAGTYRHLYDQAGLMVRLDETTWLKAGIEFTDGKQHLSTVVTHEFSDWSLVPLTEQPDEVHLRLTRYGTAVQVEYALPSGQFQLVRLAYLPLLPSVDIGVMCCSPERADFEARFTGFTVHEALPPALHSE